MRDNYFRFYRSTYSHPELPPAWAVLEELSLGTVSNLLAELGTAKLGAGHVYQLIESRSLNSFLRF
ncbi:hypothetical protein V5O39_21960 [Pseudomonas parakoreensis]